MKRISRSRVDLGVVPGLREDPDRGMVGQVLARRGGRPPRGCRRPPRCAGRSDPRAQQDRRRRVRAGGQDHLVRLELSPSATTPVARPSRSSTRSTSVSARSSSSGRRTRRAQVGHQRRLPRAVADVRRLRADAGRARRVLVRVRRRSRPRGRPRTPRAWPGPRPAGRSARSGSVRPGRGTARGRTRRRPPAGTARAGSAPTTTRDPTPPGRPAGDGPPRPRSPRTSRRPRAPAAGGCPGPRPGSPSRTRGRGCAGRSSAARAGPRGSRAGLKQQHPAAALGQARRDDPAGRAGADDDRVPAGHEWLGRAPRASPSCRRPSR